jgi:hypothetical protein
MTDEVGRRGKQSESATEINKEGSISRAAESYLSGHGSAVFKHACWFCLCARIAVSEYQRRRRRRSLVGLVTG